MREPTIFWGPGKIEQGVISDIGSTMDLFATFSALARVRLPNDRILDSHDLGPVLFELKESPRKSVLYYRGTELYAVRLGDHKAHFITQGAYGEFGERKEHNPPLLYNLNHDPSEKFDVCKDNPGILPQIKMLVKAHNSNLARGEDQLAERE